MSCDSFHALVHSLPVLNFPFTDAAVPSDGIYVVFERGERAHGGARIVRIGTHTGEGQLPSRLRQHFLTPNKDRSIFRKNIGRALLARDNDPFLADWEIDLTPRAARAAHVDRINMAKQQEIEDRVSAYMRDAFSVALIPVGGKEDRLRLESRMISTVSLCPLCVPSAS
ncbi:MAG TPA: hypothetical protein VF803_01230 [Candidatus Paceibacterota bacterium]